MVSEFQLGIPGMDYIGQIVIFMIFFGFIFFQQRLMLFQVMFNLERAVRQLESNSTTGKRIAIAKASKNPSKSVRESIGNFMDFFVIEPVNVDPYGAMKRIEHLMNLSEKRFHYFVDQVAPGLSKEEKANMNMTLAGAMSLNQIMKIVRHYVEIVRKTRNLQIAILLQMQMPMIEKISKAMLRGTEAFARGWPVGDSIGPYIASQLIDDTRYSDIADDETIVCRKKIRGREVFIVRAKGPGGRLGKLGVAVNQITSRNRISKIITIDAAAKLEGERTGSVAEGVGVAIGGIGVDRSYIEKVATARDIPLDTVVVKMSQEEAIMPMRSEILAATSRVLKIVEDNVARTKGGIVIVGVGNCTGIGNSKKDAKKAEPLIKKIDGIQKRKEKEEERQNSKLSNRIFGM